MLPYLRKSNPNSKKTALLIFLICFTYLSFQLWYLPYSAYGADEFWFAHHIYQYIHQLPYREFLPYKTVLGYYLLTPPFLISHDVITPLLYVRDELAIINTFFMCVVIIWAGRFFDYKAILLTLILLLANHAFLIYSVDIRVDMLTSWMGLISLLLVLSNRPVLSGIALGISFLISQKALWFWAAIDVALLFQWIIYFRNNRFLLLINLAAILTVAIYIFFWSSISSWNTVLNSVFYEGFTQSKITWYSKIYYSCWKTILSNGPLLIFLWPLSTLGILISSSSQRFFIFTFTTCVTIFIISYQQAFPYQMVYLFPGFFLLFSDFLTLLGKLLSNPSGYVINKRLFFWIVSLTMIAIVGVIIALDLQVCYSFILIFPICLYYSIFHSNRLLIKETFLSLGMAIIFFTGVLYPLARFAIIAYSVDGNYQQKIVRMSKQLLKENENFFAGTPLIYDKDEMIDGLKNLIGPAIEYLHHPDPSLLPMMIPSLNLKARTSEQVLQDLEQTPIKLYINNYRIASLPTTIRKYLYSHFLPFYGSIYIYAPTIKVGNIIFDIKFSGKYQLINMYSTKVYLDHHFLSSNKIIFLSRGLHTSTADFPYRLKLIPDEILAPQENQDKWYLMLKAILV